MGKKVSKKVKRYNKKRTKRKVNYKFSKNKRKIRNKYKTRKQKRIKSVKLLEPEDNYDRGGIVFDRVGAAASNIAKSPLAKNVVRQVQRNMGEYISKQDVNAIKLTNNFVKGQQGLSSSVVASGLTESLRNPIEYH